MFSSSLGSVHARREIAKRSEQIPEKQCVCSISLLSLIPEIMFLLFASLFAHSVPAALHTQGNQIVVHVSCLSILSPFVLLARSPYCLLLFIDDILRKCLRNHISVAANLLPLL